MKKNSQSKPKIQTKVEGVLFCVFTRNSVLKKELMKIEDFVNGQSKVGKIRIVERAGPKLGQILTNKTPWKKEWCGREGCLPCQSKPGTCRTLNPTYKITCLEC